MHTQPGQANVTELAKRRKSGLGRKDSQGQEAVIKLDQVKDKVDYLVGLYKTATSASADLNDGIKAIAEKSGLLASVVRKYVVAKAGDKFEEKAREVEQLSLLFDVTEPAKVEADADPKVDPEQAAQALFCATQTH